MFQKYLLVVYLHSLKSKKKMCDVDKCFRIKLNIIITCDVTGVVVTYCALFDVPSVVMSLLDEIYLVLCSFSQVATIDVATGTFCRENGMIS